MPGRTTSPSQRCPDERSVVDHHTAALSYLLVDRQTLSLIPGGIAHPLLLELSVASVGESTGASRSIRIAISLYAASNAASVSAGAGSGTDQCNRGRASAGRCSYAMSHT